MLLGHEVLLLWNKSSSMKKGAEPGLLRAISLVIWTKGERLVENTRTSVGSLTARPPLDVSHSPLAKPSLCGVCGRRSGPKLCKTCVCSILPWKLWPNLCRSFWWPGSHPGHSSALLDCSHTALGTGSHHCSCSKPVWLWWEGGSNELRHFRVMKIQSPNQIVLTLLLSYFPCCYQC